MTRENPAPTFVVVIDGHAIPIATEDPDDLLGAAAVGRSFLTTADVAVTDPVTGTELATFTAHECDEWWA